MSQYFKLKYYDLSERKKLETWNAQKWEYKVWTHRPWYSGRVGPAKREDARPPGTVPRRNLDPAVPRRPVCSTSNRCTCRAVADAWPTRNRACARSASEDRCRPRLGRTVGTTKSSFPSSPRPSRRRSCCPASVSAACPPDPVPNFGDICPQGTCLVYTFSPNRQTTSRRSDFFSPSRNYRDGIAPDRDRSADTCNQLFVRISLII